jgi:hypothetical protein
MMKRFFFLAILILFTGCTPTEKAIQTAIAKTELARPTLTLTPTITYTGTITSTSTKTPTATRTYTPTKTKTATLEPTLTLTAKAAIKNSTKTAFAATDQQEKKRATATEIATFTRITGREFVEYGHLHDSEKVFFNARIGHNYGGQNWEIFPSGLYTAAYAQIVSGDPKQGAYVLLYGTVGNHSGAKWGDSTFKNGRMCGETTEGDHSCWAFLSKAFIPK